MAKMSLTRLNVDALLELRGDIETILSRRAAELRRQIAELGGKVVGRNREGTRASALRGRKVPAKYRDKSGNTWSGRGAQPRWMTAAIKAGAKRDDFLIDKTAKKIRKRSKKRRKSKH
jgi:DNA-binding protein H-NS